MNILGTCIGTTYVRGPSHLIDTIVIEGGNYTRIIVGENYLKPQDTAAVAIYRLMNAKTEWLKFVVTVNVP